MKTAVKIRFITADGYLKLLLAVLEKDILLAETWLFMSHDDVEKKARLDDLRQQKRIIEEQLNPKKFFPFLRYNLS